MLLGCRIFLWYKLLGFRDSAIVSHAPTSCWNSCGTFHIAVASAFMWFPVASIFHERGVKPTDHSTFMSSPTWLCSLGAPMLHCLVTKFPWTCWLLGWGLNSTCHLGSITLHPASQMHPPPSLKIPFYHYPQVFPHLWLFPISVVTKYPSSTFPRQTIVSLCLSLLNPIPCSLYEGGNRQNRLHLESRTPSWARLWTLRYVPTIYGNNIPTGKPGPLDGRAPGLVPRLSVA